MSQSDAVQRIAQQRNEDLIRIAYSDTAEGYLPEVIDAAIAELNRRNVSWMEMDGINVQDAEDLTAAQERAEAHLGVIACILWMLFGVFLLPSFFAATVLSSAGYAQKSREVVNYSLFGFILWVGAIIVMIILF